MGPQVPERAVELRVATLDTAGDAADAQAVVRLVRTERIDVPAVQQMPPGGVEALDRAALGALLPHQELHPEYGSSVYSRLPISEAGTTRADTAWPQTVAEVAVGGRSVQFVAVHTYYPLGSPERWTRNTAALTSLARRAGPDTVFLGDFNASLDHTPMRDLLSAGLTDTHAELGHVGAHPWPEQITEPSSRCSRCCRRRAGSGFDRRGPRFRSVRRRRADGCDAPSRAGARRREAGEGCRPAAGTLRGVPLRCDRAAQETAGQRVNRLGLTCDGR